MPVARAVGASCRRPSEQSASKARTLSVAGGLVLLAPAGDVIAIPRFSVGSSYECERALRVLWNDLVAAGVDVVTAHNHNAEVIQPLGHPPPGCHEPVRDPNGVQRSLVDASGAHHDEMFGEPLRGSDGIRATTARSDERFGVLRLEFHESSYDWSFADIDGVDFRHADERSTGPFSGSGQRR